MKVFLTGATGWVGSHVLRDLAEAGHEVTGLARSDAAAAKLEAAGAAVLRGGWDDVDCLTRGAAAADGVIHTAMNHDFSRIVESSAIEARAIAALGAAVKGTDKPLIVTSGVALIAPGTEVDETVTAHAARPEFPRDPETPVAALVAEGIAASCMRLGMSVHGHGDHGFVPMLLNIARAQGVSAYVGDGQNRWPAVHVADAARLYRRVLEAGGRGGPFHAVAESVPFRQIAEVIGKRLDLPVKSITPEEAPVHFGGFAMFAGLDAPASSARTRAALGWTPSHPGLIEDLDHPAYFQG